MANRMIEKYNLAVVDKQDIEMSVAATLLGVTIEHNTLKLLVEHETAPQRTRMRSFFMVRPGRQLPQDALRFVGQFALDDSPAFLYTDTDDTPASFAPDVPLVHYQDLHEINVAVQAEIERSVVADAAFEERLTKLEQDLKVNTESTPAPADTETQGS